MEENLKVTTPKVMVEYIKFLYWHHNYTYKDMMSAPLLKEHFKS